MVIAIDGPAGAGKSSVARGVAERLGFTYLDTGAMYRCVALAAAGRAEPPAAVAEGLQIELDHDRVRLDGRDVTEAIRAPEVTEGASRVAVDPEVRAALVAKQQALLRRGEWVAEGRDIALVVAPEAEVKVFLTADPGERARRRSADEGDEAGKALAERDRRDSGRKLSPTRAAEDAVLLDSTGLPAGDVIDRVVRLVDEARRKAGRRPGGRRGSAW
jgi:CMP/dCMP kinase